jgi:hypothetical protein
MNAPNIALFVGCDAFDAIIGIDVWGFLEGEVMRRGQARAQAVHPGALCLRVFLYVNRFLQRGQDTSCDNVRDILVAEMLQGRKDRVRGVCRERRVSWP